MVAAARMCILKHWKSTHVPQYPRMVHPYPKDLRNEETYPSLTRHLPEILQHLDLQNFFPQLTDLDLLT